MSRTVQVLSSNGTDHYAVTVEQGKAISCPCAGFTHRQKCRHLGDAERMDAEQTEKAKPALEPQAADRKREEPD